MRIKPIVIAVFVACVLTLALSAGVLIAVAPAQDVIVPMGPTGDIQQLYRSFDNGAWEAPVVSLAPFDDATGAAIVIDTIHHEVHEGEMWHGERTVTGVSDAASLNYVLHTGGAVDAHVVFEILASGLVTVSLFESPTVASLGTAMSTYNMNRLMTTTANSQLYHTSVVTSTGSVALVNSRILPGGNSATTRVGGGVRQGTEWILAPGTNYLLRITNLSGSSASINTVVEWYEEAQ